MIRLALAGFSVLAAGVAAAQTPSYEGYTLPGYRLDVPDAGGLEAVAVRPDTTAPPDLWLGRDKALHAGASFLLTLSGQYILVDKADLSNGEALPVAASTALLLGVLKEVNDSRRPRYPLFSWRDLAADALGIGVAAAIVAW